MARPEYSLEYTSTGELYRGSLVRELRWKKRLSRNKMANLLGCNPDSLSKVETNGVNPSQQMLSKIAQVLEVPPESFTKAPVHPRILRKGVLAGALGAGVGLGAILSSARTGQQQTDIGSQQLDQNIGLLVEQTMDKAQLAPEKRMLAGRLIVENARSVCEVLANEQDQQRR